MADNKEYIVQTQENGSILISEEVIASIAALAVREVEGVYGLSSTSNFDISTVLGKKNLRKGIRVALNGEDISIACNLIVKMGSAVMTVAQNVQEAISNEVASMTGIRPARVNVNVCGVALPKTPVK
ncbi:MAG: Asp23/Gls24 family envelope stress response protein [Oscillospiraceae bacterium]|nr:Asp23/Gls24 family envelope stress response protein [Oscillospiraceae bacterium]